MLFISLKPEASSCELCRSAKTANNQQINPDMILKNPRKCRIKKYSVLKVFFSTTSNEAEMKLNIINKTIMTQFHWKVLRSSNSQLQSISFPGINQNQNFSVHIKPDQQDKIRSESVCHFMQVNIWTLFSLFLSKKSHITSGFLRKVGVFYNRTALI